MDLKLPTPAGRAPEVQQTPTLNALLAENEDLRRQIRSLSRHSELLAYRMLRVEQSVVFQFLRWLGSRLLEMPPSLLKYLPFKRFLISSAPVDYPRWVEEMRLMDLIEKLGERAPGGPPVPAISIVVVAEEGQDPAATLASTREAAPDSMERRVCRPDSLRKTLEQCRGDFIAVLSSHVVLEREVLEQWVAAANDQTVAVHGDWDHMDAAGTRHTPRFTPEFSPSLLSHALYWGPCFLLRSNAVRNVDWDASTEGRSPVHQLAVAIASQPGNIVRVPRISWHSLDTPVTPRAEVSRSGKPQSQRDRASLVICSRSPKLLRRSLTALKPTLGEHTEVIVVAHEVGTSGPLAAVCQEFGARHVPYRGPFHFGMMNGQGAQQAAGSVLVFLNDDVFPVAPDWLDHIVAQAERPDVGAAGALLLYPSGKIQHAGVVVGGHLGPDHIGRFLADSHLWPWLTMARDVSAVTGACLAIRRAVWDELGGFDPRFPVNYNDTDLCLRARKLGYRVVLEADAVLTHEESQSRDPRVQPEEFSLFSNLWSDILEAPDPYFHPALMLAERDIRLRTPWSRLR